MRLLLILLACPKPPPPPPPEPEPVPGPLVAPMNEHFDLALKAHDAVVKGDLDAARAAAAALRDEPIDALPDPWRPFMADVKVAAEHAANADSVAAAAVGVARIGQACGECHGALGTGPAHKGLLPDQEWTAGTEMLRHAWGAHMMWLGLVGSSDAAWSRGAGTLADEPFEPGSTLEADARARFEEIELTVHAVAKGAVDTEESDARVERYAELVTLCASCHALAVR